MSMKLDYTLRLADDAMIIGHRLSEWCGHGPILEQDIALTNIALDHLGRARSLYQYAALQFNAFPVDRKKDYFTSVTLQSKIDLGINIDEDDLAYLRDGWDYRNLLITEQLNQNWGYTIARSFFYDAFNYLFYSELLESNDQTFSAIAEKSLKEITYHLRWSSEWVMRLGDGTEESNIKVQQAVNELWMYTGEFFIANDTDKLMLAQGTGVDLEKIKSKWLERIAALMNDATIKVPTANWMQQGGKSGRHSEHLGYILAEMQFMQRAYPGMEW